MTARTKPTTRYQLLSPPLLDQIEGEERDDQARWLFLSSSEEFRGRWEVSALWPDWYFDYEPIVGHYRTISPVKLGEFLDYSEEAGYHVVFDEPPEAILSAYEHLQDDPPFALPGGAEGQRQGFYRWQIEGFNKLIRDEAIRSGLVVWDTGTGKTAFITAALKWHEEHGHPFELAMVVVKKHNKLDTARKLHRLGGYDPYVVYGNPAKRDGVYAEVAADLGGFRKPIMVTNYESFRNDDEMFKWLLEERDVLFFWDEMPTRLSSRNSKLYEAIQKSLWKVHQPRKGEPVMRMNWARMWELSATPIENNPEGMFNCVRLMDPMLLGTVTDFDSNYVTNRNQQSKRPDRWGNLDKLEGKIEFMTHRVSKDDPDVAAMFPRVMPPDPVILIDWDERDRAIYDMLATKAVKVLEESSEDEFNVLALIQTMQMLCDAPSMIGQSAENHKAFQKALGELGDEMPQMVKGSEIALRLVESLKKAPTDDRHTKLDTLREMLQEKHPDDKVLVYMTWASYGYAPLEAKLQEWDVSYVSYAGTDKQRQEAKDRFRSDPDIRVFLSSDKGSDSIDLPEAAVGINYNLPWTWTRRRQREGRNNRVDSELETVWWYDLIMANSVEQRKQEIIATKRGYHEALFEGKAAEDTTAAKLSHEDLIWILRGS